MKRAFFPALPAAGAVFALAIGLLIAPTSTAAPDLPDIGDRCSSKEFWNEIPVKDSSKDPAAKPDFSRVKDSNKADRFVCIPFGWYPEAGLDFKAPFGQWTLDRYPVRVKWDPDLYKPDPEHDPCRITTDPNANMQTLTSYDRVARGYIPSVGRVRGLMVSVATQNRFDRDFDDSSGIGGTQEDLLRNWWRDSAELATYAGDYYWNQSRGRMNLTIDVDEEFRILAPDLLPEDWSAVNPAAVISALDADGVDFTGVDFVIFQVPGIGRVRAYPARDAVTVDSQLIQNSHGLLREARGNLQATTRYTLVHEMGHLLGLPDLYAETATMDNNYADRFALNHSLMDGSVGKGFTGYERWLLGWMPTKSVRCVLPGDGYAKGVGMSTVDSVESYGHKLVMFPVVGDSERMRVMELRDRTSGFWDPGVLVYEIYGASPSARTTGLDASDARFSRAPLTAYRDDWTTLERTEARPNGFGDEARQWDDAYDAAIRLGAVPQSVRQPGEAPSLTWDDGQVLTLDDLDLFSYRGSTRANLRYGFGR